LDSEFLALSFVFMLLGITGIILFNGPPTPSGDSCYCIIPSPEPGAAQGTSSILLALGVMFFPMGLMKGGLPSFRKGPGGPPAPSVVGGKQVAPLQILSGGYFVFGLLVLLIGFDAVFVPAYLVYKNFWFELAGALLTAAGAISMLWGVRRPKTA